MLRLLTALACLVAAAAFVPAAPIPKHLMRETPFAYPTSLRTKWVYERDGKEETEVISEVTKENDGAKLVTIEKVDGEGKRTPCMVLSIREKGVFVVAEAGEKYDTPWCLLELPYRPGQTWTTEFSNRVLSGEGTMTAGPVEKVRIPAGEFYAVRVDWKFSLGGAQPMHATYWWSHGVGLVRLGEHLKLKSFTPGN